MAGPDGSGRGRHLTAEGDARQRRSGGAVGSRRGRRSGGGAREPGGGLQDPARGEDVVAWSRFGASLEGVEGIVG